MYTIIVLWLFICFCCLFVFVNSGDSNSGPHACVETTLPMEPNLKDFFIILAAAKNGLIINF